MTLVKVTLAKVMLDSLLKEIRACRVCAQDMPHEPRPVIQAAKTAKIVITGQAPGTREARINISMLNIENALQSS